MGGGGIGTVIAVITGDLFEVRDRAFYQGLVFVGFGAGMGLGGPIGGYLTHWAGWRSAFYGELSCTLTVGSNADEGA
jgi:MFS family permease